jgi:hypothetical protein
MTPPVPITGSATIAAIRSGPISSISASTPARPLVGDPRGLRDKRLAAVA